MTGGKAAGGQCTDSCCGGTEAAPCGREASLQTAALRIEGLDCADCAAKLESAVGRLKGIVEAQVNFTAARMRVVYDSALLDVDDVIRVASGFGYRAISSIGAEGRRTVFRLSGLDCADCAAKLEKRVAALCGVQSVAVHFGTSKMTVGHTLRDQDIAAVVRQAGYEAVREGEGSAVSRPWWRNARMAATAASGVLLALATVLGWAGFDERGLVALYALVMLVGGFHVAKSGLYSLRSMVLDTNVLMMVAALGAAAIGEWSEGASVVFLFSLGNALQACTMDKTRDSIRSLMELAPAEALVRRNGEDVRLRVEEIAVGDLIVVRPGERIAMDGTVARGFSTVNQAAITGESMPVEKEAGDSVYAGTVNEHGALEITVTRLAEDSTLAKIMHLVEEAQAARAPMQQFVDVFARYYTPAVIFGAVALAAVPPLFGGDFDTWFYRALVLLVISCPCALVISTPVSIVSAIGNSSRNGVLIKGGVHMERLGQVRAVAFDKTGTLTAGKPEVTDVVSLNPAYEAEDVVRMAAAVERWSEHPIAQAVLKRAGAAAPEPASRFQALLGRGARAEVGGRTVYVGNVRLFESLGPPRGLAEEAVAALEREGKTVVLVGTEGEVYGAIAVADTLREKSAEAIRALREAGVEHVTMLTGDNRRVAAAIAQKLDLDGFYSDLLPEDKATALRQLARTYGRVAMVGDGVNDAPALATASVGVAMGVAGSDTALETADVALMADDLGRLPYAMTLSRKTLGAIKQNIAFSLAVKLVFVAGTFFGFVNLWLAVLSDMGASLLVTLNGMRLMRRIR